MKKMCAIFGDANVCCGVNVIVAVSTDMITFIYNEDFFALGGKALSKRGTREACANYKEIVVGLAHFLYYIVLVLKIVVTLWIGGYQL
jgi:hypothetical protein